jgi:Tfp pilus assembly protein PilE
MTTLLIVVIIVAVVLWIASQSGGNSSSQSSQTGSELSTDEETQTPEQRLGRGAADVIRSVRDIWNENQNNNNRGGD